jgi:hypothetical protein
MRADGIPDREVYQRLSATADALEAAAAHAATLIGETAFKTAAQTVRGMATAVYEHSLAEGEAAA